MNRRILRQSFPVLLLSLLLAACGGGDSGNASSGKQSSTAAVTTPGTNAPAATGNTATDGFNWFNYRRQMVGIAPFVRNSQVDTAAQGHSNYQKTNNTITHQQDPTKPGFTGVNPGDRLSAANYTGPLAAYGEVISSTSDTSGFNAAEDLITAIYHRFVIFEPVFRQAGAGSATVSGGSTYLTVDFIALNLGGGLGVGNIVTYPVSGQQKVQRNFFSDNELPDPIPGKYSDGTSINEVGFPISVHADITSRIVVKSFTVQPHGGQPLAVRTLSHDVDLETPSSGAAIIPLSVLAAGTTYDVSFIGTVDDVPVSRAWSFTTQ